MTVTPGFHPVMHGMGSRAMLDRSRFKPTMGFYWLVLLVSVAFPVCGAMPMQSAVRTKRDISTEGEKWKEIEANVTELVSACGDYASEHETVISAVKALRDANSRLLKTVENASLSMRMLVDDGVFPSLDENVSPSYQKLLDYTKESLVDGMLTIDSLATAFTAWIKEEDWNKILGDPIRDIQSDLAMVFNPVFGPLERKQGKNMLKISCEKLDPAGALGYVWKHLGEGCPNAKGLTFELNMNRKIAAPNVKALPCAPEETMISNNYTTAAALELLQFFGGIIGNLGFVLAACLNVGYEASAKAEAFRFAASVNEVSDYVAKHLFELEDRYFPDLALAVFDTVVGKVGVPAELPDAVSEAVKSLDETYTDFKHTIIGFRTGSRNPHVGYYHPDKYRPDCVSAEYERSTYAKAKSFHNLSAYDYVINRAPPDAECQNKIWQQYVAWKMVLEDARNKTLIDLWSSEIDKSKCDQYCNGDGELITTLLTHVVDKWNFPENGFTNAFVGCYSKSDARYVPLVLPNNGSAPQLDGYKADCDTNELVLYFMM